MSNKLADCDSERSVYYLMFILNSEFSNNFICLCNNFDFIMNLNIFIKPMTVQAYVIIIITVTYNHKGDDPQQAHNIDPK